ncbi:hypothetical protein DRW41_03795 [Neobacillus piezotolerans]|uniref:Uncharacterized protein n=1 Tax=Neobacillus piezotolerans TaxID=2259171 RepID=A0A3D8GW57_9BACI|nr:hypothetical protein DRW41_03795 [Neobacillus piezotolerans]
MSENVKNQRLKAGFFLRKMIKQHIPFIVLVKNLSLLKKDHLGMLVYHGFKTHPHQESALL